MAETLRRARPRDALDRVGLALALAGVTSFVSVAIDAVPTHADAAGPTDYLTEVVDISPAVPGISARILGGDSFIELTVAGRIEVIVLGYQGEPYLRFTSSGQVLENDLSPSRYLNDDRYAGGTVPADADPDAAPRWRTIGSEGRWAWHDHRTHWMSAVPPLGLHRGDQILDGAVPLLVDGVAVEVQVVSHWLPQPSTAPVVLALVVGFAAGATCLGLHRRRPQTVVAVVGAAGATALLVGAWQTWSLPAETGPPIEAWALPAMALSFALVAALRHRSVFARASWLLLAAVQLGVWAVSRRSTLTRAVLPTSAPFWLDRAVTTVTAVVALVGAATAAATVIGEMRRRPSDGFSGPHGLEQVGPGSGNT